MGSNFEGDSHSRKIEDDDLSLWGIVGFCEGDITSAVTLERYRKVTGYLDQSTAAKVCLWCEGRGIDALLNRPLALALWSRAEAVQGHEERAIPLSQMAQRGLEDIPLCVRYEALFRINCHLTLSHQEQAGHELKKMRESHSISPGEPGDIEARLLEARLQLIEGDMRAATQTIEETVPLACSLKDRLIVRGLRLAIALRSGRVSEDAIADCGDIESTDPEKYVLDGVTSLAWIYARLTLAGVLLVRGEIMRARALIPQNTPDNARLARKRLTLLLGCALGCGDEAEVRRCSQQLADCGKAGYSREEELPSDLLTILAALPEANAARRRSVLMKLEQSTHTSGLALYGARVRLVVALEAWHDHDSSLCLRMRERALDAPDINTPFARFLAQVLDGLLAYDQKHVRPYLASIREAGFDQLVPEEVLLEAALIARLYEPVRELIAKAFGSQSLPSSFMSLIQPPGLIFSPSLRRIHLLTDREQRTLKVRFASVGRFGDAQNQSRDDKPYRISLFGGLRFSLDGNEIDLHAWRRSKARELCIAALVLNHGNEVPREQIIELIWPHLPFKKACNNYYVTWCNMRKALAKGNPEVEKSLPLESNGARCYVDRTSCVLDIAEYDEAVTAARDARIAHDSPRVLEECTKIARLYRGDLLAGDGGYEWLAPYREYYHTQFIEMMLLATELCIDLEDYSGAIHYIDCALHCERCREVIYELAMEAYLKAGRREDAIMMYHACKKYLTEELGLDPSEHIRHLYATAIRA